MNPSSISFPLHRAVQMTAAGIFLKRIGLESPVAPVRYAHRDDYYLFGLVEAGHCRVGLDFQEYSLNAGDMLCVRPGQIHRLVSEESVRASVLFVDGAFVGTEEKRTLTEFSLRPQVLRPEATLRNDLSALYAMIERRTGTHPGLGVSPDADDESDGFAVRDGARSVVRLLAGAAAGMVAEVVRRFLSHRSCTSRQVDLALLFRELLDRERLLPGGPARYAAELHVSPGYLSEAVRSVTGKSTGRCIHDEQILRARRMLIHTSLNIREIAFDLGFDDAAYFTRLFTRMTGVSPSGFRRQYLE